jgi:beta-N-acetylhexosaminidase
VIQISAPKFVLVACLVLAGFFGLSLLSSQTSDRPDQELDRKIGQMLMVGFRGLQVDRDSPIVRDIRERHIGGVILFDYDVPAGQPVRNIQSPQQLRRLTGDLQRAAPSPLLIAIDQEGGRVNRLKERFGFPPTISAAQQGRRSPEISREAAERTARSLAEMGINLNFAPVVDLNTNPENPVIGKLERSFSPDPSRVAAHAREWVAAHRRWGVLATLKHFPGHGSSKADSHLGFVDVTETWTPAELQPYSTLIKEGLCDVVMTAHIFNSRLDPELPATLSRPVITGILRQQLRFKGLVVSDDMQMKAITDHYGLEAAIEKALNAGVDLLIFANNSVFEPDIAERAVQTIKKLLHEQKITRSRIEEANRRIFAMKERLGREAHQPPERRRTSR